MVGEPADIEIDELEFDDRNTEHLAQHGVTPSDVQTVLETAPLFFTNLPGRSASHIMLGPDKEGSFFFVVMLETARPRVWRVVTAYRYARRRALRYYRRT